MWRLIFPVVPIAGPLGNAAHAAQLRYPSLGNLRLDRGTVELWIEPRFDPQDTFRNRYLPIMEVRRDDREYVRLFWKIEKGRTRIAVTRKTAGFKDVSLQHGVPDWKAGQRRHLAYCWEPGRIWLLIDGRAVAERPQTRKHTMRPSERLAIVFGNDRNDARIVIDDLRISSVPRREDEVGFHRPGRLGSDPFTLLLDTFDDSFVCDGTRETTPAVISTVPGQQGGRPEAGCGFVDGVAGTALRL